eukprot:1484058-Rhodomonas_salina.2
MLASYRPTVSATVRPTSSATPAYTYQIGTNLGVADRAVPRARAVSARALKSWSSKVSEEGDSRNRIW